MSEDMQLVEQHLIRRDDPRFEALDKAAFAAKNIYNCANYQRRQAYIFEGRRLSYKQQEKGFKKQHLLPDQQLPMKCVQQVLRQVDEDWHSFRAASAEYAQHPDKFTGRPRLPRYKHKTQGRAVVVFTEQAISKPALRRGEIALSGLNVSVKTRQQQVNQVRVVPRGSHYVVEVVYTATLQTGTTLDNHLYAGLDVGLNNLAAVTSNKPGFQPVLVNGRPLKSINQYYNKQRARLQGLLPVGQFTSRQLRALTDRRNRRIDALLHLASRYLIDLLVREGIGQLVIGKNDGWKQEVNLGKRTNQNFVNIPHARFIQMLVYKAQLVGIQVHIIQEAYTSKCSFLDQEPIAKHETYLGKRVHRGLFRACTGQSINADLNGAYNILRLVAPAAFDAQSVWPTHGIRLTPSQMEKNLQTWAHAHNGCSGANGIIPCSAPVAD